jgi:hypothetical protein
MVVLLLPAGLLVLGGLRTEGKPQLMMWLGTIFQLLVCVLSFLSRQTWRQPVGPSVVALYLIALGWMWLAGAGDNDWYLHLAQALLLVIPLAVFALQTLTNSGAPALRRAQLLAQRLARRKDWPADLGACRTLPEVKAFREALHLDATPALALLQDPRSQVRVAALAALEFRKSWRSRQVEYVLRIAQTSSEPLVRAGCISALANVDDRPVVEALAEFLRDRSWDVRRAAMEAVLWDCERRWPWVRNAIRGALADPLLQNDGALRYEGPLLTPDAVADLNAWAAEKGLLGVRAALTLGTQYGRCLNERADDELVRELQHKLANPHTAPTLRMELAKVLQTHRYLSPELLNRLLSAVNPAPLRLTAADALLAEATNAEALAALRDIARLPNREIALATAEIVQRRLGVDLGLAPDAPLPPLHSRQAAEVTRRVMMWTAHQAEARVLNVD